MKTSILCLLALFLRLTAFSQNADTYALISKGTLIPSGTYEQTLELGVPFQSREPGQIDAIRFYKAAGETSGTHTGHLWSSSGTMLASVTFTGETASGWQTGTLAAPYTIAPNTTYVASVNSLSDYVGTDYGLQTAINSGPLISGTSGVYGTTDTFPSSTFDNSNYFRDVSFQPTFTVLQSGTPATYGTSGTYELGMKFFTTTSGSITQIRFYKVAGEGSGHTGHLWTSSGSLMASGTFSGESSSGWQAVNLPAACAVAADTTYVVSVDTPTSGSSNYAYTSGTSGTNGLAVASINGPLSSVTGTSITGSNGVFSVHPGGFPTDSSGNANYYRDVTFVTPNITHGDQLTKSMTGPWALLATGTTEYPANLGAPFTLTGSAQFWRFNTTALPPYVLTGTYDTTRENDVTYKGGIVGTGGAVIDGISVPAGVYVVQFQNIQGQSYLQGITGPGIFYRGCQFKYTAADPGPWNTQTGFAAKLWITYCDIGAPGITDWTTQYMQVCMKIGSGGGGVIYRNYMSWDSTAIQISVSNYDVIENYSEQLIFYGNGSWPPWNTAHTGLVQDSTPHLNGIKSDGGPANMRVLRNVCLSQTPDAFNNTITQTDDIGFLPDEGTFPGTGTNADGTLGYMIKDNYIGGSGNCVMPGFINTSVTTNFVLDGNTITTQWYPATGSPSSGLKSGGGFYGTLYYDSTHLLQFGTNGNVMSNNIYEDGTFAGDLWFY